MCLLGVPLIFDWLAHCCSFPKLGPLTQTDLSASLWLHNNLTKRTIRVGDHTWYRVFWGSPLMVPLSPQKRLWLLVLPTAFPSTCSWPPTRCHSQCCPFQTAYPHPSLWDRKIEPQILPYLWFVWGWWWCSGWTACYFPLHTPSYIVSSQEIWDLILRGKSTGWFYFFAPEQQQTHFSLHDLIVFYEQASSRTLWLKAFPCNPCKPCNSYNVHMLSFDCHQIQKIKVIIKPGSYWTRHTETLNCQPTNCSVTQFVAANHWGVTDCFPTFGCPCRLLEPPCLCNPPQSTFAGYNVNTLSSGMGLVPGQACNSSDPHWSSLSLWRCFTVPGTKWLLS